MTEPTRPPTDAAPPDTEPDALVARYLEAAELLAEQRPDAQLRAAVLAQAQLQAWKHADGDDDDRIAALDEAPFASNPIAYDATQKPAEGDFYTELPLPAGAASEAANDRRWRLPAIASVAILGLAGLLSLQFQRSPEIEQQRALGRPAALPSTALTESDIATATAGTASPANSASPAPAASVATDGAPSKPEAQALARTEAPASPSAPSANPAAGRSAQRTADASPHRPERKSPRTVPTERQTAPGQAEPRHERPSGQPNTAGSRPEVTAAETAPQAPLGKAGTSASAERRAATPLTPAARRGDRPGTAVDSASASIAAASSRPARTSAVDGTPHPASPLAEPAVDDGAAPLPPPPTPWSLAPPSRTEAGADAAGAVRAAPSLTPSQRLLAAAAQGRVDEARRALADGAPVEASDAGGRTALMLAAQRGNVELTRLLTGAGADPRRPDARGHDAIDHARRAGNEALARFLEQHQAHAP